MSNFMETCTNTCLQNALRTYFLNMKWLAWFFLCKNDLTIERHRKCVSKIMIVCPFISQPFSPNIFSKI